MRWTAPIILGHGRRIAGAFRAVGAYAQIASHCPFLAGDGRTQPLIPILRLAQGTAPAPKKRHGTESLGENLSGGARGAAAFADEPQRPPAVSALMTRPSGRLKNIMIRQAFGQLVPGR